MYVMVSVSAIENTGRGKFREFKVVPQETCHVHCEYIVCATDQGRVWDARKGKQESTFEDLISSNCLFRLVY